MAAPYILPRADTYRDSRLPHGVAQSVSLVEGGDDVHSGARNSGNPNSWRGTVSGSKPTTTNAHRGGSNWPPKEIDRPYGNLASPGNPRHDSANSKA